MKLRNLTLLVLVLSLFGGSFLNAQRIELEDWDLNYRHGIAAIVEGRIITMQELREKLEPIVPQIARESRNQGHFQAQVQRVAREILQNEIDRVLIVKAFEDQEEMQIPPSVIENEFENSIVRDFDGDRGAFLEFLRSQNQTIREYQRELREDIIISVMRSRNRQSQAEVSPERIEEFYNENKIRFYQEESVRLRQCVLTPYADESEKLLLENAEKIIKELENGTRFEEVARRYSQDDMARRGGDWGWIKRSDIRPELGDVAFALEEGQWSEPLVIGNQVYILFIEERRPEGIQDLSEVRDTIERFIVSDIARNTQDRWLERLRADGYVKYFL